MIACICFVALLLLVWFKTDALIEYLELTHLTSLFYADEYLKVRSGSPTLSYHEFLLEFYNCFLTRLITCPICFSVWVGIFVGLCSGSILSFPVYSTFGLLTYLVTSKLL